MYILSHIHWTIATSQPSLSWMSDTGFPISIIPFNSLGRRHPKLTSVDRFQIPRLKQLQKEDGSGQTDRRAAVSANTMRSTPSAYLPVAFRTRRPNRTDRASVPAARVCVYRAQLHLQSAHAAQGPQKVSTRRLSWRQDYLSKKSKFEFPV